LNLHLDGPLARRQNRALGGTLIDLELLHHRFLRRSHAERGASDVVPSAAVALGYQRQVHQLTHVSRGGAARLATAGGESE
jgi:hypothetical protein